MEQKILVQDNSGDKKYFTIIPNYIANHSSAYDQALYFQLKRLTDDSGKNICYPSIRYLQKQLKAGQKTIRKSIKYLIDHKWIEDSGKKRIQTKGGWQWVQTYKVNDIWQMNMEYYKGVSKQVHLDDTKVYPKGIQGVSKRVGIRRTIDNKEHISNYKMFYHGQPIIKDYGKLYVLQGGNKILFVGKESEIEHR